MRIAVFSNKPHDRQALDEANREHRHVSRIMTGFGCHVLAHDPNPSAEARELGVRYVDLEELWGAADVVALHLPLTPESRHLVDADAVRRMKPGVMLVNTTRGALVDTRAVIAGLESGRIGSPGLDVYEEETTLSNATAFETGSGELHRVDLEELQGDRA